MEKILTVFEYKDQYRVVLFRPDGRQIITSLPEDLNYLISELYSKTVEEHTKVDQAK